MSISSIRNIAKGLTRQLEQLQSEPHEHPFPVDEQPQSISMVQWEQDFFVLICRYRWEQRC